MLVRLSVIALAISLSGARALDAQMIIPEDCTPEPLPDTVHARPLFLRLAPQSWLDRIPPVATSAEHAMALPALALIRGALPITLSFTLPDEPGTELDLDVRGHGVHGVLVFSSVVRAALDADGEIRGVDVLEASGTPIDSALLMTAVRVARAGGFHELQPTNPESDSIAVRIVVGISTHRYPMLPHLEIADTRSPVYAITMPRQPAGIRPPAYPENLRQRRVEATINTRFIVRSTGAIDSLVVDTQAEPEFVQAIQNALRNARYDPATIGGCPVDNWAPQLFVFRLTP